LARLIQQRRDDQGRWMGRIEIRTIGDSACGRLDEVLTIHTDDPVYQDLQIPVTIIKQASRSVLASPDQVLLEVDAQTPEPSCLVRLRGPAGRPLVIEKAVADDPAFVCRWATNGDQATIKIQLDKRRLPAGNCVVRVHITSPIEETLSVPVRIERR
jgi:hypothetical protein